MQVDLHMHTGYSADAAYPQTVEDKVRACLDKAGLTEKIDSLPKGIDTQVGREVYEDGVLFSGGQTQRLMLARALYKDGPVLLLDEPTRGIDVGAKYEIYTIMHDLIKEGKSIIMISSEMPELLGMADRVMVMCEGRVTGFLDREEADSVSVMRLATKFM